MVTATSNRARQIQAFLSGKIKVLISMAIPGILKRFYEITGRPDELYGIANLDAFSVKRQRMLPAKCRVYDLLNFASEVATHQTTSRDSLQLQAYIGSLVSDEYDMEGTANKVGDFQDFFVRPSVN